MKEATKQSVSILMITFVAAMAIFVLNKFTLPAFTKYQENRITIQEKREALKEVASFEKLAKDLNAKYNSAGGDFSKIVKAVPTSPQFSDLLATLDSIGRLTSVGINDIAFRDVENKKAESDLYSLAEVSLNITGTYENIVKFFDETEKELRLMDAVSLNMKKTKNINTVNNKRSVSELIEVNAVIQAYYQK